MKRVVILVIDSMGVGAMKDAAAYGDLPTCNTLANVASFNNGLHLPNLGKMGLGNITHVQGVPPTDQPIASFGKMEELSKGKDTTTGHWEMAGLVLDNPFRVYPQGFPKELMDIFVERTGCGGYIGNIPASGTEIIEWHHQEHTSTGHPIIYTSADSVFQIAVNVDVIPIETLYEWCEIARELLDDDYNTSRVIARPYRPTASGLQRISALRRDYSVVPMKPTVLDRVKEHGGRVMAIGKIEDIFVGAGVTHAVHMGTNREGLELTIAALAGSLNLDELRVNGQDVLDTDKELIFINLVDTDMLFGHRNDAAGYGNALEEIDRYLEQILPLLTDEDLLLITADHGCDPTHPGTDHTREMVPLIRYNRGQEGHDLGTKPSFTFVASETARWLGIPAEPGWVN